MITSTEWKSNILIILGTLLMLLGILGTIHHRQKSEPKIDIETRVSNLEHEVRDLKLDLVKAGIIKGD